MRAPNGQGCCLSANHPDLAIAYVGDVIRRCGEQLAMAVNDGCEVEFRIQSHEVRALERLFPEQTTTGVRLMALINTAMKRRDIRYELTDVRTLSFTRFAFRVKEYQAPIHALA